MQNGFVEGFNGRLRDERLNATFYVIGPRACCERLSLDGTLTWLGRAPHLRPRVEQSLRA